MFTLSTAEAGMKILLFSVAVPLAMASLIVLLFRYSPGFKRTFGKYFYNWLYGLKWGKARTNNYGYAPASEAAAAYSQEEKYQIQLYQEVITEVGESAWKGRAILEVGCGRGGGLHFLHQSVQPSHAHGLDFSTNAIRSCKSAFAAHAASLHFIQGDAMALPFDSHTLDIVFNVESSHIYSDQARFLEEVARVLKPGGTFLIADYRPLGQPMQRLREQVAAAGLMLLAERDIGKQVLAACREDTQRREALIANAPAFSRSYLREFAMTGASKEFERFEQRYCYFLMAFQKNASPSPTSVEAPVEETLPMPS